MYYPEKTRKVMYGESQKRYSEQQDIQMVGQSVPLPALTNLSVVFINMSQDERKSFPHFKVITLSIKLRCNTSPAISFCTQRQL